MTKESDEELSSLVESIARSVVTALKSDGKHVRPTLDLATEERITRRVNQILKDEK